MNDFAPAPCIPDEGIEARIPASPFSVLTLIEVRNRLSTISNTTGATPEALRDSLNLSLAQVYAALAYYYANQTAFDAELVRRRQTAREALLEMKTGQNGQNGWAELIGKWPGDESDAQIEAALERLS